MRVCFSLAFAPTPVAISAMNALLPLLLSLAPPPTPGRTSSSSCPTTTPPTPSAPTAARSTRRRSIDRLAHGRHAVQPTASSPTRSARPAGPRSSPASTAHINGVPVFNRFDGTPADARQVSPGGRLPHRHDRQVAPRQRPDRLRLLEHPARPGRVPRPGLPRARRAARSTPATAPTSSPTSRSSSSKSPAQGQAVLPDVPPQGAAPALAAGREAPQAVGERRRCPSRTTFDDDYATRADAAREATMRIDRDLTPTDLQAEAARGPVRRRR